MALAADSKLQFKADPGEYHHLHHPAGYVLTDGQSASA